MNTVRIGLIGCVFLESVIAAASNEGVRPLPPVERPEAGIGGWTALFDGETLSGWRGFRMETVPEGWVARGGVLRRSGKGGNLMTLESFGDFELYLEWAVSAGGNSGIIVRASEETTDPWHSGPEMQIYDPVDASKVKRVHAAGALYDLVPVPDGLELRHLDWNRVWIRVVGTRYTFALNGVVTADLDLAGEEGRALVAGSKFAKYPEFGVAASGHVVLQDHGDAVAFRRILLRRL
ncbi:MAG: DUF1080 domain-containing protein [Opitutaceae bacterium]